MTTYDKLTTGQDALVAAAVATLTGAGYSWNPLTTSFSSYLATALTGIGGSQVSNLTMSMPQLLAGLVNALGAGPVSHLTSGVHDLLARLGSASPVPNFFVSPLGSDSNDGKSIATPWQTLSKVAASAFAVGSVIAFLGGATFAGSLVIPSSGSALAKIRFTSYGIGRAKIAPGAANTSALVAADKEYFTIDGIDFDGTGATGSSSHGIHLTSTTVAKNNITIQNFSVTGFTGRGVFADSSSTGGWANLLIQGFVISGQHGGTNSRGIEVSNSGLARTSTNVQVVNGAAHDNDSDGCVVSQVVGGLTDLVLTYNNGGNESVRGPVGNWIWSCTNYVIRRSESYGNTSPAGVSDGGGFDMDGECQGCVVERSYAHGNKGAGILCWQYSGGSRANSGNKVRFCVTENNGSSTDASYGEITLGTSDTSLVNVEVYNNVLFSSLGSAHSALNIKDAGASGFAANNILRTAGGSKSIIATGNPSLFLLRGNNYSTFAVTWNSVGYTDINTWATATAQEKISGTLVGTVTDPKLHAPGFGGTVGGYDGVDPTAYALDTGSPMIGAGIDIFSVFGENIGTVDFYGTALTNFPVGAYGGAGATPAAFTTLNPADKSTIAALSNGNLTITNTGTTGNQAAARSVKPIAAGEKKYFEARLDSFVAADVLALGIVDSAFNLTSGSGNQIAYWNNDGIYNLTDTLVAALGTAISGSSIIRIAVDNTSNKRVWFSLDGGNWNGSGSADPATNVGGVDITGMANVYACLAVWSNSRVATANFGPSWAYAVPSGFTGIAA